MEAADFLCGFLVAEVCTMHRRVFSVVQNLECSRRRKVVKSRLATGLVTTEYFLEDLIIALYEWGDGLLRACPPCI